MKKATKFRIRTYKVAGYHKYSCDTLLSNRARTFTSELNKTRSYCVRPEIFEITLSYPLNYDPFQIWKELIYKNMGHYPTSSNPLMRANIYRLNKSKYVLTVDFGDRNPKLRATYILQVI